MSWKESEARVMLQQLVADGQDKDSSGNNKKPKEVYLIRQEFQCFDLKDVRTSLYAFRKQSTQPPKAKKGIAWRRSKAKFLIFQAIKQGHDLNLDGSEKTHVEMYEMFEECKHFPIERFKANLKSLRSNCKASLETAQEEHSLIVKDIENIRSRALLQRTYPRWDLHDARKLLRFDVEHGFHKVMTPKQLHAARDEYKEFPLHVFRKHIYQEVLARKQRAYNAEIAEKKWWKTI